MLLWYLINIKFIAHVEKTKTYIILKQMYTYVYGTYRLGNHMSFSTEPIDIKLFTHIPWDLSSVYIASFFNLNRFSYINFVLVYENRIF